MCGRYVEAVNGVVVERFLMVGGTAYTLQKIRRTKMRNNGLGDVIKLATISSCGTYRYFLSRFWDGEKPPVLFIMLNPSTADGKEDDATIRKCLKFSKSWGFGGLHVVNLFAFRATDKSEIRKQRDPIGYGNDDYVLEQAEFVTRAGGKVVCAWGTDGTLLGRDEKVLELLKDFRLHAVHVTKDGHPGHPLYLKDSSKLKVFKRKGQV